MIPTKRIWSTSKNGRRRKQISTRPTPSKPTVAAGMMDPSDGLVWMFYDSDSDVDDEDGRDTHKAYLEHTEEWKRRKGLSTGLTPSTTYVASSSSGVKSADETSQKERHGQSPSSALRTRHARVMISTCRSHFLFAPSFLRAFQIPHDCFPVERLFATVSASVFTRTLMTFGVAGLCPFFLAILSLSSLDACRYHCPHGLRFCSYVSPPEHT